MNEIKIPLQFVEFANEWHDGQSSLLYAIASTESLSLGTNRPYELDEERPMTDSEWMEYLLRNLRCELKGLLKRMCLSEDRYVMEDFLEFVNETLDNLPTTN